MSMITPTFDNMGGKTDDNNNNNLEGSTKKRRKGRGKRRPKSSQNPKRKTPHKKQIVSDNVEVSTPNDPSSLRVMKTNSVEEVLASRKAKETIEFNRTSNNRRPNTTSGVSRRRIRRPGRRPISPTYNENDGPRSPLHDLYMNSVDNLRAEKWLAEQQEKAQKLMEEDNYLYNNSAAAEEQFDQEDDERDEVVILREQCEFLAQRLQSMEATFQSLTPNQRPSTSPVRSTRDINHFPIQEEEEYRDDSELDDAESNKPGLTFTLKEIKGTLARLDGVFTSDDEDSELKLGNTAVTQIGKIVRGWLVRCKYKRLKTALRRWRRRRTKPIRREFVRIVRRRRVIDSGVELMITTRNINCKKNHFEAWQKRTKELLPLRIQQRAATKKMRKKLRDKFLRKICVRWWTIANGPSSRKSIALKNRMRMEEAHERITKRREQRKLPKTLITKEMLREEMGMEATRLIQTNRRHMLQKELFLRWVIKCVMPWRSKRRIADKHFLRSRGKYIFKLMRKYVKGRQELHGATKKKYTGRQRWEMRHNLHVIKLHHQHRLLKTHFLSWRTRAHQRAIVKRSFQGHINTLATNVLKAWRLEAEKQIKIKAVCVAEWRLYGMSLYKIPFRAWYVYAKKRKEANFTRDTLIRAWDRRKIRSLLYQIFKVWRHQALYGKTEGMHTRLELIKVVEDQKKVQQMMSRNLDGAEDALRELKKALDQEKANNNKLKKEVENARREREKYDFASHNAEQDIVRLQSLLDSVSLIHPGTIKQLKALDESRSFKDRGIEDLARARSQRAVSQQPASEEKPTSKHAPPPLRKDKLEKGPTMGNGGKGLDIPDMDAGMVDDENGIEKDEELGDAGKDGKVWVSPYDADVILRINHVKERMQEPEKQIGQPELPVEKPKTKEEARLRGLLLYLTTGDETMLQLQVDEAALATEGLKEQEKEEEEELTEEEEKIQLRAHLGMLNQPKIARTAKWGDFLDDMMNMYPLRHRINLDAQQKLAQRIVQGKKQSEHKKLHGRPAFNLLSQQEQAALQK